MTLEGSAVASWNTIVRWPDLRSGSERTLTMSTSSSRILPATSARIPSLFGTLTSIRQPGSGNPASVTRARITSEEVTIPNTSSLATADPPSATAPSATTGRLSLQFVHLLRGILYRVLRVHRDYLPAHHVCHPYLLQSPRPLWVT